MSVEGREEISAWVAAWGEGDDEALGRLMTAVYPELRRLARRHLGRCPPGQTLESAALANEAYLKLANVGARDWKDSAHFLAVASSAMRSVLVDYARWRSYAKRGGNAQRVSLSSADLLPERLGTEVSQGVGKPLVRSTPLRAGTGRGLDPSVPTVLVVHALSGDARAAGPDGWWGPLVGPGRALDPARVRVLCANNLGSCYGSSGPLDPGWPEGPRRFTPWDQARALWSLLDTLGLERLRLATGASLGGMIAICLAVLRPGGVERLLPIGTASAASAWVAGWNHVSRQILRLDPGWPSDVGRGLELARQLAMLTYRAEQSLDARHHRAAGRLDPPWALPIKSYLEYQARSCGAGSTPGPTCSSSMRWTRTTSARDPRGRRTGHLEDSPSAWTSTPTSSSPRRRSTSSPTG